MRTTKRMADEPTTSNHIRVNMLASRRRVLTLAIAASGLVGIASFAAVTFAQHPEPINRLGRVGGCGWSDGYHACQSSGTRPFADLPPLSYTSRANIARFTIAGHMQPSSGATYYDQFDHACRSAECDSVSPVRFDAGCDTVGDGGCDASVDPYNRGIFGLRHSQDRLRYDPVTEQRRREQEALDRQRDILAEEERQREYRVFEKYRVGAEERKVADDEATMTIPSPLPEPIKAPAPVVTQKAQPAPQPEPAPKSQRGSDGNWLPQRIPPDSAKESSKSPSQPAAKPGFVPAEEDLREDSPSDLPIEAASRQPASGAELAVTGTNVLAQSQFYRPRSTPTRLPQSETVGASGAHESVKELPEERLKPTLLPPVPAPVSKATDEAQTEPAKRVASADWLIIRQPK